MSVEAIASSGAPSSAQPVANTVPSAVPVAPMESVKAVTTVTPARESSNNGESREGYQHQPSQETIRDAVNKTNGKLGTTKCEFSYHKGTHRVSIKIRDKETNEVVKEIPPEESLEMLQKMWEISGIMVDEKR